MDTVRDGNVLPILEKYSSGEWPAVRHLTDGGVVIGDAVDEDNRLLYVIKRGEEITVEYAQNQPVVFTTRPVSAIGRLSQKVDMTRP